MNNLPAPNHPVQVPGSATAPSGNASAAPVIFAAQLLSFSLLAALLYWGRVVAIPLALAILLSFTLKPLVRLLQRCYMPRALAVVVTVSGMCGILAFLGWMIGSQLAGLSNDLPQYRDNIANKIKSVRGMMKGGAMERIQGTMETLAAELNEEKPQGNPADVIISGPPVSAPVQPVPVYLTTQQKIIDFEGLSTLLPIVDPLTTAALVLVLVVLMLLRWEDLRSRIISFSGHQNLTTATRACDDAGHRITRYLILQLIVNGSYGITFAIGLYMVGVPYAALWGLCSALFRYLPYVGPVVGGALPIIFSLVTSDGWTQPLWVGGILLGLELVSNNIIEPWLYGSRLGLSEVGIIMAAVAWTFLWGPVGLVLATPLTVCLVVLGEYIPAFSIFARLLGDTPVLDIHFRFYQRLLADDLIEATEIAKRTVREEGMAEAIDSLLVPALSLAERDQVAGLLGENDEVRLSAALERIFDQMLVEAEKQEERARNKEEKEKDKERDKKAEGEVAEEVELALPPVAVEKPDLVPVMIWPVIPLATCAAPMLKWMLRNTPCEVIVLAEDTLSSDAATQASRIKPAVLCLLSLTGSPARRERQLAKRIDAANPNLPIVAARLGSKIAIVSDNESVLSTGNVKITHTLADTCAAVRPFVLQEAMARG